MGGCRLTIEYSSVALHLIFISIVRALVKEQYLAVSMNTTLHRSRGSDTFLKNLGQIPKP